MNSYYYYSNNGENCLSMNDYSHKTPASASYFKFNSKTHFNGRKSANANKFTEQILKYEQRPSSRLNSINANFNQVQDYNALRKAKSAYIPNSTSRRQRIVYDSVRDYEQRNSPIDSSKHVTSGNNSRFSASKSAVHRSPLVPDTYLAADGTVHKQYVNDGLHVSEADHPTKNVIHIPGKYHEHYRQWLSVDEVPLNLKHKFGTQQTSELLKDELKVHDTLSHIHNRGHVDKKSIKDDSDVLVPESLSTDEPSESIRDYYDLGNHLRYVIGHGYPLPNLTSQKEYVHNANVSKEYLSDWSNVESPYRRKKDWLIKWTEHNIVRERLHKSMANVEAEKAKLASKSSN